MLCDEAAESCIVVVRDVGKLVELLEMWDDEEFVVEESLEDGEVVRVSPSAATVLIIHIVAQVLDVLGLMLSMVLFLSVLRDENLSSHIP